MLARRTFVSTAIDNALQNAGTLWLMGFIALAIGAIMVPIQEVWSGWQAIVTLMGWVALIKGIVIIMFPESVSALYRTWNKRGIIAFSASVSTLLGLLFLYEGFVR